MVRFNQKGEFNIPFCRKPRRFAQAYVTKITNQVSYVSKLLKIKHFTFKCQEFQKTISESGAEDIIYCDPPYIDRHTDYYNGWDSSHEEELFKVLSSTPSKFILSTWHHNNYRENEYIKSLWSRYNVSTQKHFYHVGASENNRNPIVEAVITNYNTSRRRYQRREQQEQLALMEKHATYSA